MTVAPTTATVPTTRPTPAPVYQVKLPKLGFEPDDDDGPEPAPCQDLALLNLSWKDEQPDQQIVQVKQVYGVTKVVEGMLDPIWALTGTIAEVSDTHLKQWTNGKVGGSIGSGLGLFKEAMTSLNQQMRDLMDDKDTPSELLQELEGLVRAFSSTRQLATQGCVKTKSFAHGVRTRHLDNLFDNLENGFTSQAQRSIAAIAREVEKQKDIFDSILKEHERIAEECTVLELKGKKYVRQTEEAVALCDASSQQSANMMKGGATILGGAAVMACPITAVCAISALCIGGGAYQVAQIRKDVQQRYGKRAGDLLSKLSMVIGAIHVQSKHLGDIVTNLDSLSQSTDDLSSLISEWNDSPQIKQMVRSRINQAKPEWKLLEDAAEQYLQQDKEFARMAARR